jgi:acyl dehydratase
LLHCPSCARAQENAPPNQCRVSVGRKGHTVIPKEAPPGSRKPFFPNPVFAGDTLRSESECLAVRESKSRPNAGIVTWAHRSFNQRDELVCECTRTALLLKKPR